MGQKMKNCCWGQSDKYFSDWSKDACYLAYEVQRIGSSQFGIWILPMGASRQSNGQKPFPFLQTEFNEVNAVFSPDRRWIAYHSNESGRDEVYIRPFPGPSGKWQVSTTGGSRPRWRGDEKELFFVMDNNLMAAPIKLNTATVEVGRVQTLFQFNTNNILRNRDMYDVTRDGQKFLLCLRPKIILPPRSRWGWTGWER